jgi:lipopolysaccharide export system protein LptA
MRLTTPHNWRVAVARHSSAAALTTGRIALAITALVFCSSLIVTQAQARESDLDQPIEIAADRSEFDERAGRQILEGNVRITQGTMLISAERIEIALEDGSLAKIVGTGSPLRFEQDNESGERMRGAANRISYDAVNGSLVLEGKATLTQPGQSLASERIVFNGTTQTVRAEGDASGTASGRVQIRIEPPPRNR